MDCIYGKEIKNMKKNNIRTMLLSVMLLSLASCDNAATYNGGEVKKGKVITVQEAKEVMDEAASSMQSEDALSLSMKNASYHSSYEIEKNIPLGKEHTINLKADGDTSLKNITFEAAMKGLTSDKKEDVKASLTGSADIDIHGKTSGKGVENSYQTPKGKASLNFYVDGTMNYLDLSDNNLQSVISTTTKNNIFNKEFTSQWTGMKKVAFNNGLEDDDMPLLTKESINHLTYKVSQKIEDIASKGGTIKALEHDDGTYSYSVSAKDLEDASSFKDEIPDDVEDSLEDGIDEGFTPDIESNINVNEYSIAFVFDKTGIRSIGATIDIDASYNMKFTTMGATFTSDAKYTYAVNFRLDFASKDNVTVKEVTDKDTYSVLTDDFDF